jgi:hypothetical protein
MKRNTRKTSCVSRNDLDNSLSQLMVMRKRKLGASVTRVLGLVISRPLLIVVFSIFVVSLLPAALPSARSANPAAATITPGTATPITWVGEGTGVPPAAGGEGDCDAGGNGNCDTFILTISGQPSDWIGKQVRVTFAWMLPSTDYDMYIHKGSITGPIVASSGQGGSTEEHADLNPQSSSIGTGDFYIHAVYFASNPADQYSGAATVITAPAPPVPAPPGSGLAPRYENYTAPAAGPTTLGLHAGEPSIGIGKPVTGHPEGRAMFQSDLQTLRVTFNGACGSPRALWEDKSAPTSQVDFDPILFTDPVTGRTIVSLLTFVADTLASESSYSDNDGDLWLPSQGAGVGSGIDHQTLGGGPYNNNSIPPPPPHPAYANAVYFASQDLATALAARSDNGGASYGNAIPMYTTECGGLHGHIKISPTDGTVYLPNKGCTVGAGQQGVVVSTDNGLTWVVRTVPGSSAGGSDPSVGIGSLGKIYLGYADGDTKAVVSTSTDRGLTWTQPLDVGATFGINNVVFPEMVAGDNDRAAFAFLGTPTAGGLQGPKFVGVWHVYVAHTFDGGQSWITVDATPNDPVQRGCIWLGGGANICRNLLDFNDVQVDYEGRVLVAYADGCAGGDCAQAAASATGNSYTALAAISRQSGGRRLYAAFDPPEVPTPPGTPTVTVARNGAVRLAWSEADDGASPITQYKILRGTTSGGETLLTTVGGTVTSYTDPTATDPGLTYFYRVTAVNAVGESCGNNEVAAAYVGDSCVGFKVAVDPTGDQTGAPGSADLDIQTVAIAEPFFGAGVNKLVFKMKMASLTTIPPERMWRLVWNSPNSPVGQYYVGMTSDSSGVVTFEYGTVETAVVGLVLGVPTTTRLGDADAGSEFATDGIITIVISNDKVGNPMPGDLLGAIALRTYSVVSDQIRSTNAIDTLANAAASDPTANSTTYAVVGNICNLVSGTISYCIDPTKKVPNATVATTSGSPSASSMTDANGAYQLTGLLGGPYTVAPSKPAEAPGIAITAFDAGLVAQFVAGVIPAPNACQVLAGDASNSGALSALDAGLIAQTVAGITNTGIAGTWKFVPPSRSYPSLAGNLLNQNYDAVLVGDVSGNWPPSGPQGSGPSNPVSKASIPVSLPNTTASKGSTNVMIPVIAGNTKGLNVIAYDFTFTFNPKVIQPANPAFETNGTLSQGWSITPNTSIPGKIRIVAFNSQPLAGSGTLIFIKFNVVGSPGSTTPLTWTSFPFNEGSPAAVLTNGKFTVQQRQSGLRGSMLRVRRDVVSQARAQVSHYSARTRFRGA